MKLTIEFLKEEETYYGFKLYYGITIPMLEAYGITPKTNGYQIGHYNYGHPICVSHAEAASMGVITKCYSYLSKRGYRQ